MIMPLPISIFRLVCLSFMCVDTPKYYLTRFSNEEARLKSIKALKTYYTEEDAVRVFK